MFRGALKTVVLRGLHHIWCYRINQVSNGLYGRITKLVNRFQEDRIRLKGGASPEKNRIARSLRFEARAGELVCIYIA